MLTVSEANHVYPSEQTGPLPMPEGREKAAKRPFRVSNNTNDLLRSQARLLGKINCPQALVARTKSTKMFLMFRWFESPKTTGNSNAYQRKQALLHKSLDFLGIEYKEALPKERFLEEGTLLVLYSPTA